MPSVTASALWSGVAEAAIIEEGNFDIVTQYICTAHHP